ncbi:MAG: hypothetical protein HC915_04170, partial [Anaerolineae bacterium]|nr:hypothetical protein [Anaerolineae bacterium]
TAAAPTPAPAFQPDDCPAPRSIAAPALPASSVDLTAAIGVFLSNGGAPAVLEGVLRGWGAITPQGGVVQADTDLTGDRIPEVLVNLYNPFTYNPEAVLNAGRLLIYGCDNDGYRLLYATPDNPGLALPVLHRVGDLNADIKAEVVYDIQSCTSTYCNREGAILSWNPIVGVFEVINSGQMLAINGRLGVLDADGDGILEITAASLPVASASSGPVRGVVDVWDYTGTNYVLAQRYTDDPRYRIHAIHDADAALLAGNLDEANRVYLLARDAEVPLLSWSIANEFTLLRAMANFRLVTTAVRGGNVGRAEQYLNTLSADNPPGSPGEGFLLMAQVFMERVRAGEGSAGGCAAVQAALGTRPELLALLNSYGSANRFYQPSELCPF